MGCRLSCTKGECVAALERARVKGCSHSGHWPLTILDKDQGQAAGGRRGAYLTTSWNERHTIMNNLLKTGIAGFAAWKLGGGIIGTIIVFLIVFWLLGMF